MDLFSLRREKERLEALERARIEEEKRRLAALEQQKIEREVAF